MFRDDGIPLGTNLPFTCSRIFRNVGSAGSWRRFGIAENPCSFFGLHLPRTIVDAKVRRGFAAQNVHGCMKLAVCACVLLAFSFHSLPLCGKVAKDTLFTTDGDRIILTYEVTNAAGQTTIRFWGQQKKLGKINAKYKDLSKVAVMFFDRIGNYGNGELFVNMVPEPFMTPAGVRYEKSADGYYMVQSELELSFTANSDAEIRIPIYLAYKQKKGKYVLFSKSKGLKIPLRVRTHAGSTRTATQTVQQTITSTAEIEPDNADAIKVLESIGVAEGLIAEATELPFSDNLLDEIRYLREKRREVTDNALVEKIANVMESFESKRHLLEEQGMAEQQAHQLEAELKAQEDARAAKAQTDSIEAAQKAASEKEKKRSLWMIVGGAVLAFLAFIGNQVVQGIMNRRNRMQMMNMQQEIANKAEREAKRRARNAARAQRNKVENEAKRQIAGAIQGKGTLKVNGKSKNASI